MRSIIQLAAVLKDLEFMRALRLVPAVLPVFSLTLSTAICREKRGRREKAGQEAEEEISKREEKR